jgi:hypothetical protein
MTTDYQAAKGVPIGALTNAPGGCLTQSDVRFGSKADMAALFGDPPKADMDQRALDICLVPIADIGRAIRSPTSGREHPPRDCKFLAAVLFFGTMLKNAKIALWLFFRALRWASWIFFFGFSFYFWSDRRRG